MQNYDHIYSKERIDSFINKYKDQVNIDPTKQIKCGIINIDEINIAVDLIQKGYLVAFPTETVYALNLDAILSIFSTKGDLQQIHQQCMYMQQTAYTLINLLLSIFSPNTSGPAHLQLLTRLETTSLLSANTGYIGIRIPNNQIALQLLQLSNLPIAAPSANLFTHISLTTPYNFLNNGYDQPVHIIDGQMLRRYRDFNSHTLNNSLQIFLLGISAKDKLDSVIQSIPELQHFQIFYEIKIGKEGRRFGREI
ncbi:hypothetical protein pb186bvf_015062 [Paramecium bursaria]